MSEHAPRAADMPPPRDASGLSQGAMRVIFTGTYRWLLASALRLRLTPFQLTLLSLVTNVVVGVLLARNLLGATLPSEVLAAELQRRGWIVVEP